MQVPCVSHLDMPGLGFARGGNLCRTCLALWPVESVRWKGGRCYSKFRRLSRCTNMTGSCGSNYCEPGTIHIFCPCNEKVRWKLHHIVPCSQQQSHTYPEELPSHLR
ncbi:unnamed protein product [Ectocarpus sp. 12 AP-2014]